MMLTTFARPGYLRRALDAGVSGYLLKDAPPKSWPTPSAASTRACASSIPQLAQDAWGEGDPLTDKERQILRAR